MNPLLQQLTHRAFPELADALRAQTAEIILECEDVVREAMPQMNRLTFTELRDSLPKILPAVADAMASADANEIASVSSSGSRATRATPTKPRRSARRSSASRRRRRHAPPH